jgi:hypothetical protein
MYARKVSLCLKSGSVRQFLQKVEDDVIPLFRKQKGFLDQLILLSDNGEKFYVYTFWENSDGAERYDRTTLPELTQLLAGIADGALRVHPFAGSRGCLTSALCSSSV